MDTLAIKTTAFELTGRAESALSQYLDLHEQLFSWKNAFGWNRYDTLKTNLPLLLTTCTEINDQVILQTALVKTLLPDHPDQPLLSEFYERLGKYTDFLCQAVQVMPKLLTQIEAKATKSAAYKQKAYELDLAMYKQKVNTYQLYGQELNQLLPKLALSLRLSS